MTRLASKGAFRMSRKRLAQVIGATALAGALAGGLAATRSYGTSASTPDPAALRAAIASTPAVTVATFASGAAKAGVGSPVAATANRSTPAVHVLLIQRLTKLGMVCVWDATRDGSERGGGCNSADDPLGGKQISVNTTSSTGSNGVGYSTIRVSGLAAPTVATLNVQMSDGTTRPLTLQSDVPTSVSGGPSGAFAYNESSVDLAAGVVPIAVVAFDQTGKEVATAAVGLS